MDHNLAYHAQNVVETLYHWLFDDETFDHAATDRLFKEAPAKVTTAASSVVSLGSHYLSSYLNGISSSQTADQSTGQTASTSSSMWQQMDLSSTMKGLLGLLASSRESNTIQSRLGLEHLARASSFVDPKILFLVLLLPVLTLFLAGVMALGAGSPSEPPVSEGSIIKKKSTVPATRRGSWGTMLGSSGFYGPEMMHYKAADAQVAIAHEASPSNAAGSTNMRRHPEHVSWGSRMGSMGFAGAEMAHHQPYESLSGENLGQLMDFSSFDGDAMSWIKCFDLGSWIGGSSQNPLLWTLDTLSGGFLGTTLHTMTDSVSVAQAAILALNRVMPRSMTDFVQDAKDSFEYAMKTGGIEGMGLDDEETTVDQVSKHSQDKRAATSDNNALSSSSSSYSLDPHAEHVDEDYFLHPHTDDEEEEDDEENDSHAMETDEDDFESGLSAADLTELIQSVKVAASNFVHTTQETMGIAREALSGMVDDMTEELAGHEEAEEEEGGEGELMESEGDQVVPDQENNPQHGHHLVVHPHDAVPEATEATRSSEDTMEANKVYFATHVAHADAAQVSTASTAATEKGDEAVAEYSVDSQGNKVPISTDVRRDSGFDMLVD